jgi:lysylphosphatidylglycerol synthetase-like protein (DUF2156 family)
MSILLPFLLRDVMPIDFAGSIILYIILLVIMAFVFWLITFYMQFHPHFFGEPTKFSLITKRSVEMLIGLFALIIVVFCLPAYYISTIFPFKASEEQMIARERLSEKKSQS